MVPFSVLNNVLNNGYLTNLDAKGGWNGMAECTRRGGGTEGSAADVLKT